MIFDTVIRHYRSAAALTRNADKRLVVGDDVKIVIGVLYLAVGVGVYRIDDNQGITVKGGTRVWREHASVPFLDPLCERADLLYISRYKAPMTILA